MMAPARVLLADDHDLVVEALVKLIEPHFTVVGTVADGHALLTKAVELRPDVIVLDIGMPQLNGMDAGRKLRALLPHTKLIALTMNEHIEIATQALHEWASGYLLKKSAGSELIKAIREVQKGNSYVTPRVAQQLLNRFMRDPTSDRVSKLSSRQREVLQLLAEGKNMRQVARILGISARTVAFHKYRIMEEYELRNSADLLRLAVREHIVSPLEISSLAADSSDEEHDADENRPQNRKAG
jgi:DNA-binding NarL/FixJ family response regulator